MQVGNQLKLNVSKEIDTLNSMCGKNMGFDYGIASESGEENDKHLYLTAAEISTNKTLCKKCLKILNKN
jgi:hypothetical protein